MAGKTLEALRAQIDGVDGQILDLFKQRMEIAREVARVKKESASAVYRPGREREILCRAANEAGEELESYARILFSTLMDLSRSWQITCMSDGKGELMQSIENAIERTPPLFPTRALVACQGVEGAYSQQACDRLFRTANILYFKTFDGVFNAVEQGLCRFGILPIENSTYGTVNQVYDLMMHHRFHIVRSLKYKINHVLLAKPGVSLDGIREIFSHEQAIGQCSAFLKSLKDVRVTVCENTAAAAKMVSESERTDVASISSPACAALYGLNVLGRQVSNTDSNFTRFICIEKEPEIYPGANRISLLMTLPHTPGALYQLIAKFSALGLNLTKLESRPIPGRDFEFMFYFDLEASVFSKEVLTLLDALSRQLELFMFLGCYQEV
ncbi:MAG: chorismate mutase [Clostridia bacterium]|nr:chorismate mutase [Clostridia bacterium]